MGPWRGPKNEPASKRNWEGRLQDPGAPQKINSNTLLSVTTLRLFPCSSFGHPLIDQLKPVNSLLRLFLDCCAVNLAKAVANVVDSFVVDDVVDGAFFVG